MLKQKSILQAGSQESVFYKLIDGLESVLKASTSGLEIIFEIRIKSVLKLTRSGAALLVS